MWARWSAELKMREREDLIWARYDRTQSRFVLDKSELWSDDGRDDGGEVWDGWLARHYRGRLYVCECAGGGARRLRIMCWSTRMRSAAFALGRTRGLGRARLRGWWRRCWRRRGFRWRWRAEITPTPALSYAVRERKAAGGVMITSSHNPAEWNGVKYKASYGGSGKPSIMTAIESYLEKPLPG